MPHYLSSRDSGSSSPSSFPSPSPPPAQNNSLPSSRIQESENVSHLTHPVYPPQPNGGDQQPSQPIVGYHSTTNGTSVERSNLSSHHPEVTQPSMMRTPAYVYQPQSSQYHQTQSNGPLPFTPAPTTSDVHNRSSRSNSISSTDSLSPSVLRNQHPAFAYPYILTRFLTVNPAESPLAYDDRRAISEGFAQVGDDIFARRTAEQRWMSSNRSDGHVEQGSQESDDSRTLGRSRR